MKYKDFEKLICNLKGSCGFLSNEFIVNMGVMYKENKLPKSIKGFLYLGETRISNNKNCDTVVYNTEIIALSLKKYFKKINWHFNFIGTSDEEIFFSCLDNKKESEKAINMAKVIFT